MKVVVASAGKFHNFALARELLKSDSLHKIITGNTRFKLRKEQVPADKISAWPLFRVLDGVLSRLGLTLFSKHLSWLNAVLVDAAATHYLRRHPDVDLYIAISSVGTRSGAQARALGIKYICDRGSSHILYQQEILLSEYKKFNIDYDGFDQRIIERELEEYANADVITVPSEFAYRSFIAQGIPAEKMVKIPYGVNLTNFHPCASKSADSFDVLYVGGLSARKGMIYLFKAFEMLRHPNKRLLLIGEKGADFEHLQAFLPEVNAQFLGAIPNLELKKHMSSAHVLVLPSVEDGFGLVMAEAMACGCPVIATENTGAMDLFDDGVEGYIVPIRDEQTLADRFQRLADDPALAQRMADAARQRMQAIGGWTQYGEAMLALFQKILRGD